jgi:hypothetical protein
LEKFFEAKYLLFSSTFKVSKKLVFKIQLNPALVVVQNDAHKHALFHTTVGLDLEKNYVKKLPNFVDFEFRMF